MIFDLLLAEKYRIQQELAREGGEDIKLYLEYIHQRALAIQKQSGLSFKYAVPEGFVPPVIRTILYVGDFPWSPGELGKPA